MFSLSSTPRLAGLLMLAVLSLQAEGTGGSNEVRFQDPAKPGLFRINLSSGKIHVSAGKEPGVVRVVSSVKTKTPAQPREDGLRVLGDTQAAYSLTANGNNAELSYDKDAWGGDARFEITVPADTALQIQSSWGGDIAVEDLSGDLSIQGMNCDVSLDRISGGTNVEIMNGKVNATYTAIQAGKPVSISSMNGPVVLKVPEDTKANVRFRTHNGAILTDFNENALKTKSEDLGGTHWGAMAGKHTAVAVNIAKEVGREIAIHAKDVAEEIREAVESQREEVAEAARDAAEAAKDAAQAAREAGAQMEKAEKAEQPEKAVAPAAPEAPEAPKAAKNMRAPRPPRPPIRVNIPALSGGKVVSGTLNEGGTSVQVTLMNGDITFRKVTPSAAKP
jgi:gas vesicle protein